MSDKPVPERWRSLYERCNVGENTSPLAPMKIIEELGAAEAALSEATQEAYCHASRGDGECNWKLCPQVREGEPKKTGRRCPLDEEAIFKGLQQQLSEAQQERDAARAGLERDRTKLADALKPIREATASRFWLTEGRGCYEWDDDRYREEFGHAIAEINDAIKGLESVATDWRDCPQTSAEVAKARIDLQQQVTQQAATIARMELEREQMIQRLDPEYAEWTKLNNNLIQQADTISALTSVLRDARSQPSLFPKELLIAMDAALASIPREKP
jgi:DNA repair exonuclease SbcCD ATPase subunit